MPAAWVGATSAPVSPPSAAPGKELVQWWTAFGEPTLTSLVDRAFQSNRPVFAFGHPGRSALGPLGPPVRTAQAAPRHSQGGSPRIQAAANRKAADLATKPYTQGQTDFLNVLQAHGALSCASSATCGGRRACSAALTRSEGKNRVARREQ
jgi:outer membrane protein TolC